MEEKSDKKSGSSGKKKKKGVLTFKKSNILSSIKSEGKEKISKEDLSFKYDTKDYFEGDNNSQIFSSNNEDYSDDEDEGIEGYHIGGYHPVYIGEIYNSRYKVIEKLGWGHFSTVWMAYDFQTTDKKFKYIALKVQKSAKHYIEAAYDEIELLNTISSKLASSDVITEYGHNYEPYCITLLNNFEHFGPHGKHVCMTFEILGENLLKVIKLYKYNGIPIPIVKRFTKQILLGIDFLHRHCSIIHTDLKPENILIKNLDNIINETYVNNITSSQMSTTASSNIKKKKKSKKKKKIKNHKISNEDETKNSILQADNVELEMRLMEENSLPNEELMNSNSSSIVIEPTRNDMMKWFKPTLTSLLNLNPIINGFDSIDNEKLYKSIITIPVEAYERPLDCYYSRISMVTTFSQLVSIFGPPIQSSDSDSSFSTWYLKLVKKLDNITESNTKKDFSQDNNIGENLLTFTICGRGIDIDNTTKIVSNNLFENSTSADSISSILFNDNLVVWDIIHNSNITEDLLHTLERLLNDLVFICVYDLSIQNDDNWLELLGISKISCIHPNSSQIVTNKNSTNNNEEINLSGGYLLGINTISLYEIYQKLVKNTEIYPSTYNEFKKYFKSFDLRYFYFTLEYKQMIELCQTYDVIADLPTNILSEISIINNSTVNKKLYDKYITSDIKIVDLGNACWVHKHFTNDIQTRQYRCPEVILGLNYDTSSDIWSIGCIVFELLTGDLLFDPKEGKSWDRDEDHLALMIELLNDFPKNFLESNSSYKNNKIYKYFNKKYHLKNIKNLKYWPLKNVLSEKYKFSLEDSNQISDFLLELLQIDPNVRADATKCLLHPWLQGE